MHWRFAPVWLYHEYIYVFEADIGVYKRSYTSIKNKNRLGGHEILPFYFFKSNFIILLSYVFLFSPESLRVMFIKNKNALQINR